MTPSTPCARACCASCGGEHSLDEQRKRRLLAKPVEVVPGQAEVREGREHRRGGGEHVLLRRFVEPRQEHRVGEVLATALSSDERQIRLAQVPRPPAESQGVDRHHDRAVPRRLRTLHEARADVPVIHPVELEPARRVRRSDVFHRVRRRAREHHRDSRRGRRLADCNLCALVRDREHADRREHERPGGMHAEHVDRDVALDVPGEHPRTNPPLVERVEVRAHRRLGPRATGDIAERPGVELLLRRPFPVVRRDRPCRRLLRDVDRVLDQRSRKAHGPILIR